MSPLREETFSAAVVRLADALHSKIQLGKVVLRPQRPVPFPLVAIHGFLRNELSRRRHQQTPARRNSPFGGFHDLSSQRFLKVLNHVPQQHAIKHLFAATEEFLNRLHINEVIQVPDRISVICPHFDSDEVRSPRTHTQIQPLPHDDASPAKPQSQIEDRIGDAGVIKYLQAPERRNRNQLALALFPRRAVLLPKPSQQVFVVSTHPAGKTELFGRVAPRFRESRGPLRVLRQHIDGGRNGIGSRKALQVMHSIYQQLRRKARVRRNDWHAAEYASNVASPKPSDSEGKQKASKAL